MTEKKKITTIVLVLFIILSAILGYCYYSFINLNNKFKNEELTYEIKNRINKCQNKILQIENKLLTFNFAYKQTANLDTLVFSDIDFVIKNAKSEEQRKLAKEIRSKIEDYIVKINGIDKTKNDTLSLIDASSTKLHVLGKLGLLDANETTTLNNYQKEVSNTLQSTAWIAIISFFVTFFILMVALNRILSNFEDKQNQIRILESINRQKNSFFSVIGHDLKNPLGSFITLTEVLESNSENLKKEDFSLYINMMKKSANNIFKLLDNLLQWSRLQMNYINFNPIVIEVNNLIGNVMSQVENTAKEKGINLVTSYESNFQIESDIWMLETVLRNLLNNAIKYSYRNGDITIKTHKQKDKVVISVIDQGVGIDGDKIKTIFNMEKRESTPGTEKENGTGLGLLICKELVEKCGEKIWVSSTLGSGTTFMFTVKLH